MSLCPEAGFRSTLSDEEFWAHVLAYATGVDLAPDYDDHDPLPPAFPLGTQPCPVCHELGACGWDTEGRPLIHALHDEEE